MSDMRKHSPVDLQQVSIRLDVYNRHFNRGSSKVGAVSGPKHEAGVATTKNGGLYLIEKGVPQNDDINYPIRYREGMGRIVHITQNDIRDWQLVRSVTKVDPAIPLEDLFDSCGSDYSLLNDRCWNGMQRMRVRDNATEDWLTWQERGAIIGGVGAAIASKKLSPGQKELEVQIN